MAEPGRQDSPRLDHVGIAVRSLDEALPLWRDQLGLEFVEIEEVPSEGVRVAVLMAGSTRIELLEPLDENGPIARHLEKRGPGLHHLALKVDEVDATVERCADAGAVPLSETSRAGAGGAMIRFLHPRGTGGVLLELTTGHHARAEGSEPGDQSPPPTDEGPER